MEPLKPALLGLALLAGAQGAAARVPTNNVFIAGDGFSIEQAVADAAAQRRKGDPPAKILVLGEQTRRLKKDEAGYSVMDAVSAGRRNGATFYACARDMRAAGMAFRDFIPGVQVVRGWSEAPPQPQEEQFRLAPERRMRSLCAE
jgi:intracellular sulfur oxidation DsrE/DsrF family protein